MASIILPPREADIAHHADDRALGPGHDVVFDSQGAGIRPDLGQVAVVDRAEAGQPAEIQAKMNSLVHEDIIRALYDAARSGVRIRLAVRGICCLRPGLKGTSEGIEVVSVVDRFLEHSRIFHFRNGGDEEVYLSSADWMPRNLDRRIELLFPVESAEGRQKVLLALDAIFQDNVKARRLQTDGSYRRRRPAKGEEPYRAQIELYRESKRALERARAVTAITLEPLASPGS